MSIEHVRRDYEGPPLRKADLAPDPIEQFKIWLDAAMQDHGGEALAMTLSTVTPSGHPDARIVLLRGVDADGFTFFTNYDSPKGRQLAGNLYASLCFLWQPMPRQVRIVGTVQKTSAEESDAYFRGRPPGSQLGAWASPQGQVIADREELERLHAEFQKRYGDGDIPRPSNWGGYRLTPESIEFWQGQRSRLHDRLRYRRGEGGQWIIERLAP